MPNGDKVLVFDGRLLAHLSKSQRTQMEEVVVVVVNSFQLHCFPKNLPSSGSKYYFSLLFFSFSKFLKPAETCWIPTLFFLLLFGRPFFLLYLFRLAPCNIGNAILVVFIHMASSSSSSPSAASSTSKYPVISQIPIDFFVYKKFLDTHGNLRFTDSCGDLVFKVVGGSNSRKVLVDASGNPLISINPTTEGGGWQGFRGDGCSKDLMFWVERSSKKSSGRRRRELEVFLVGAQKNNSGGDDDDDDEDDSSIIKSDFKIRGCPFQRSCTIYRDNSIVAQTSLLYKLGKIIVGRRKFRLTLFPGLFVDHVLVVIALVAVFLD